MVQGICVQNVQNSSANQIWSPEHQLTTFVLENPNPSLTSWSECVLYGNNLATEKEEKHPINKRKDYYNRSN